LITENLSTLKIHKLTESQYKRERDAGRLDANALYLTPEDEIDFSVYETKVDAESKLASAKGYTNSAIDVLKNELDEIIPNTIPRKIAGIVHQYAGANAPDGYLLCDGSFYRTDEYSELFNAIGFTYGESGSGVNIMFAVPNLSTRVPVGVGSGYTLGSTGGEAKHTLTVDEMPKHDHGAVYTGNADTGNKKYAWYTTTGDKIGYQLMETGDGAAHNNMQPYIALNYIISTGK
jgi:microcystin-dependent protein